MALLPLLQSAMDPLPPSLSPTNFTDVVVYQHWNPEGWGPVALYALLISLFVVAIAYMIAEILKSAHLNAWAKNELFEFLVSAFLIANLFFALTVMNAFVYNLTGGYDHFGMANLYLRHLTNVPSLAQYSLHVVTGANYAAGGDYMGDITASYLTLVGINAFVGILGQFFVLFALTDYGVLYTRLVIPPYIGLYQLNPIIMTLVDMVGVILMAMMAQKALLMFFKESMFRIFLPLGILLRAFPLSRRIGSTIIAIAITAYVVYPLTLVMNLGIYDSVPKVDTVSKFDDFTAQGCFIGKHCLDNSDCCGFFCYDIMDNPGPPPTSHGECHLFPPVTPNSVVDPADCAPIEPCLSDLDCCGGQCIETPEVDMSTGLINYVKNCTIPQRDESDFVSSFIEVPNIFGCVPFFSKCWWTNEYLKSQGAKDEVSRVSWTNLAYASLFPWLMPKFGFDLLKNSLPSLLWPVVAAVMLAIIDIIICITFFKSISETLGGEVSILGLARAL